jgi:hypothetical protein
MLHPQDPSSLLRSEVGRRERIGERLLESGMQVARSGRVEDVLEDKVKPI